MSRKAESTKAAYNASRRAKTAHGAFRQLGQAKLNMYKRKHMHRKLNKKIPGGHPRENSGITFPPKM